MRQKYWNIIKILLVILSGMLVALLWWDHVEEQQRARWYQQMEQEVRPLRLEQDDLEQQLEDIEREYKKQQTGTAALELLFTAPSESVYNEFYPLLEERSLTGVLVLSQNQFSEEADTISREEVQELLGEGWGWCMAYDGSQPFPAWLENRELVLEEWNLPESSAVYFAAESYNSSYDEPLKNAGVSIVIHHGEEELPIISDIPADSADSSLWKLGACEWNSDSAHDRLGGAINDGTNLTLTISQTASGEPFEQELFLSMLDSLSQYVKRGSLAVTTLDSVGTVLQSVLPETDRQAYEAQISSLETQMKELDDRMDDIYAAYFEKVRIGKE